MLVKAGKENLSKKTVVERFINVALHPFANIGHEEDARLSCQACVNGDCTIETKPASNWTGENFWQKPYPNK